MTTNEFHEALLLSCQAIDVQLDREHAEKFELYKNLLIDWNSRMNLTAITDPWEIAVKHFSDSLALLSHFSLPPSAFVLDVGTGAGFPGLPLKIVRPDIQLTLLDSLNKRIQFLHALMSAFSIHADTIHGRAENIAQQSDFREKFDIVTARAVSTLPTLCEYCLPFVRVGGYFLSLKGPTIDREIEESESAIQLLGGKIASVHSYVLSDQSNRSLIVIQKISSTPQKYPRHSAKLAKKPL